MHMIDPNDAAAPVPPFPMRRTTFEYVPLRWPFPGEVGLPPLETEMKVFMFDNIKVHDLVQVWLPVTGVDDDSIAVAYYVTIGRESIVGHKPKDPPDMVWATLTDEQKRELIERL